MKLIPGIYSKRIFRLVRKTCLIAGIFLLNVSGYLIADTLHLQNGKSVSGEILNEIEGVELTFRYRHHGQDITRRVPLNQIRKIEKVNDKAKDESVAPDLIDKVSDLKPLVESVLPEPEQDELVILHLRGGFDIPRLSTIGEVITFAEFQMMMEIAKSRNPKAIVLAIDSPGGLLSTCDEIVDSLIEIQSGHDSERVIAWVELGGSAAALTALACKEIVMRPNGRMGSATAVFLNGEAVPEAVTAMEHKVEAMEEARSRQVSQLTGRPIEIQLAMQEPEYKFWFNEEEGCSLIKPAVGEDAVWKCFDNSEEKPMALAANEMKEIKAAEGVAGSIQDLIEILELKEGTQVVDIDLMEPDIQELLGPARRRVAEEWAHYLRQRELFEKRVVKFVAECSVGLSAVRQLHFFNNYWLWRRDVNVVRGDVDKISAPALPPRLKKMMEEYEPRRFDLYSSGITLAKGEVHRARENIKRATQMTNTPIKDITKNIIRAANFEMQGLLGKPYEDTEEEADEEPQEDG